MSGSGVDVPIPSREHQAARLVASVHCGIDVGWNIPPHDVYVTRAVFKACKRGSFVRCVTKAEYLLASYLSVVDVDEEAINALAHKIVALAFEDVRFG